MPQPPAPQDAASAPGTPPAEPPGASPTFGAALRVWCRVAALSFGGPAGQIAVMHRILVEEKRWLSERRFLHALNYCMLLPGPEAQQLATYSGWLLHGRLGGLVAGLLFVLPGFVSILALSVLYALYRELPLVDAIFYGLKPAVLAIVLQALVKIGRRTLHDGLLVAIAAAAFVAIFAFGVPFPIIIVTAAALGLIAGRERAHASAPDAAEATPATEDHARATGARPSLRGTLATAATWLAVWWAPLLALVAVRGPDDVLARLGVFFSQVATVTFGGAYAVLAYVAQAAVQEHGWLAPGEMLDGLGMAETTPGPLIQVVQFVGFMGAFRQAGALDPLLAGVLGSIVVTWATFAPCFLWIFVGAPYIEYLRDNRRIDRALTGITAAVVGVILNLAVWFSIHTLFGTVGELSFGPLSVPWPDLATLDPYAAAVAVAASLAILRLGTGMGVTLVGAAGVGVVLRLLVG